MEEISVGVEEKSVRSSWANQTALSGPAVLGPVVLSVVLLAGLISLRVCFHGAAAELSTTKAELAALTEEREKLKANVTDLTEERNQLTDNVTALTKRQNRLQNLLTQKKACPAGWAEFSCSCYYVSSKSRPWTHARDDCISRHAHLVVIETRDEQTFVTKLTQQAAWIGLDDRDQEGTWVWVDGTPLTSPRFWNVTQPDNSGNEDCGHIKYHTGLWNDLRCDAFLRWICEKVI